MRQNYTNIFSWLIMLAFALTINIAFAFQANRSDTTVHLAKTKLGGTRSSYPKNGLHLALPPLKPAVTSNAKINLVRTDDKLLTDVQVYPNPVTDQINIKYALSRNALVTVKVMDVLGNEVLTATSFVFTGSTDFFIASSGLSLTVTSLFNSSFF